MNSSTKARFYFTLCLLLSSSFLILSCEEDTVVVDLDYGYRYFPIVEGQEKIFAVDSIIYGREGTVIDTTSGFLREVTTAVSENPDGTISATIERYYRKSATDPWILQSFNVLERNNRQAILQAGNQSLLKMIFPAS